jgi:hypothetical protein
MSETNTFYQSGAFTSLPNTYDQQTINGVMSVMSPAQVVAQNPRVAGTVTLTVGGSPTSTDVCTVVVSNPVLPGGSVTVTAETQSGDNYLANVAQRICNAITSNSTLQQFDIFATSVDKVATFNQLGPVSSFTTVTASYNEGASETITVANSGVVTGGSGVAVPMQNGECQLGPTTVRLRYGVPLLLGQAQLAIVVNSGTPVK